MSEISFEEILEVWRGQLWPGRISVIEPVSAIAHDGSIRIEIQSASPVFLGARDPDGRLIGVNSGCPTDSERFRSRGLYVTPEHRRRGVASVLIDALEPHALASGCRQLWTMPRASALPFYVSIGFETYASIDRFEFGPHALCARPLRASGKVKIG